MIFDKDQGDDHYIAQQSGIKISYYGQPMLQWVPLGIHKPQGWMKRGKREKKNIYIFSIYSHFFLFLFPFSFLLEK